MALLQIGEYSGDWDKLKDVDINNETGTQEFYHWLIQWIDFGLC